MLYPFQSSFACRFFVPLLLMCLVLVPARANFITLVNPYEDVDWDSVTHHRANLHTHTTQSDGSHPPEEAIDFYHAEGYSILALTDHNLCTWPWQTWGRDPETLGMLAIPGNEYSRHNHLNGYFLCYETASSTVEQVLDEIALQGGIAHLNHPGRYWSREEGQIPQSTIDKYVTWYTDFPPELLVGMEVINSINRYPHDLGLWDALLSEMMPERPIWGFATDDMHELSAGEIPLGGISWTDFPLDVLDEASVRHAMVTGQFFFSTIALNLFFPLWDVDKTPLVTSIVHDPAAGTLSLSALSDGEPLAEHRYRWISDGEEVHIGPVLDYRNTSGIQHYVRAELSETGGRTYTNPFGVLNESGFLTVFIEPAEATYAGAAWSVDNGATWHGSGESVELATGPRMVRFKHIPGHHTPDAINVTIIKDETTVVNPEDGALYVYDPALAVSAVGLPGMAILVACLLAAALVHKGLRRNAATH